MNKTEAREEMELDVLFVGAGVANLSAAYRLMKNIKAHNEKARAGGGKPIDEPMVLVVDKGQKVGSHVLSGAVVDPIALRELFPDLKDEDFPFETPVTGDSVYYLSEKGKTGVPHFALPAEMQNSGGYYLASLGEITRWLAEKCQEVGVEVYTEFAATELIRDGAAVKGAMIGDKGLNKEGEPGEGFTPGMNLLAKVTVIGEGTRGYLANQLIKDSDLAKGCNDQVWAVGVKEIIKVPAGRVKKGSVIHTFGYPLDMNTYGGSFIYAYDDETVGIGLVTALDYQNPLLSIHDNFLLFKKHPLVSGIIEGGEVVEYGAKTLPEGGLFAVPKLAVDGAVIVGDSAGMLNSMRLKGIHLAMKSGMLAADKICAAMAAGDFSASALDYRRELDASWAGRELDHVKNYRQGFHGGMIAGMMSTGFHMISGGALPGGRKTLPADYKAMKKASQGKPTPKTKTDQKLYLDIMTDVYKSGSVHREEQPSHLKFLDDKKILQDNREYDSPCTRYCPAEVYERKDKENGEFDGIHINFSNCLHCKTCEIKDPLQNVIWTPPEGGDGPKYKKM